MKAICEGMTVSRRRANAGTCLLGSITSIAGRAALGADGSDGTSTGLLTGHIVCHCVLIETDAGLVLVDTGFGTRDIAQPSHRLARFFRNLNNIQLRPEEMAIAQIRALGFDPADVRHIVISHLDFDHAGGIEDFPNATVHLTAREREVADQGRGGVFVGTRRYRPQQWNDASDWRLYPMARGEQWFGFDAVRQLDGLPPEILLVPLIGHTWGHSGSLSTRDTAGCSMPRTRISIGTEAPGAQAVPAWYARLSVDDGGGSRSTAA